MRIRPTVQNPNSRLLIACSFRLNSNIFHLRSHECLSTVTSGYIGHRLEAEFPGHEAHPGGGLPPGIRIAGVLALALVPGHLEGRQGPTGDQLRQHLCCPVAVWSDKGCRSAPASAVVAWHKSDRPPSVAADRVSGATGRPLCYWLRPRTPPPAPIRRRMDTPRPTDSCFCAAKSLPSTIRTLAGSLRVVRSV